MTEEDELIEIENSIAKRENDVKETERAANHAKKMVIEMEKEAAKAKLRDTDYKAKKSARRKQLKDRQNKKKTGVTAKKVIK